MRANNTKKIAKNRGVPSFSIQVLRRTSVVECLSFFLLVFQEDKRGPNFHLLSDKNDKNEMMSRQEKEKKRKK
tara:strand:- start:1753 stop:1971 length:219 start_codon:yes stop_codon:yes gene_type:complete